MISNCIEVRYNDIEASIPIRYEAGHKASMHIKLDSLAFDSIFNTDIDPLNDTVTTNQQQI